MRIHQPRCFGAIQAHAEGGCALQSTDNYADGPHHEFLFLPAARSMKRSITLPGLLAPPLLFIALLISGCDDRAPGAAPDKGETPLPSPLPSIAADDFPMASGPRPSETADPEACRACHAAQVDSWSGSHHALANRPLSAGEDLPTFSPPGQVRAGGASYGMTEHGGTSAIRAREADGSEQEYPLVGVIGHTPVRQYLASLPGNRLQATSAIRDMANDR